MIRWFSEEGEEDERVEKGDVGRALLRMAVVGRMSCMWVMGNFQFNYLPPPTGWVASFPAGESFTAYPFQTDKFRTITVVRMKIDPEEIKHDNLIAMQNRLQKQFPLSPMVAPTLDSTSEEGFSPALGLHGCSIGIYESRDNKTNERSFYLVCHGGLPDELVDSLQERDRIRHSLSPPPTLIAEAEDAERMEKVARELAIRNMILFCTITGLKMDRQKVQTDGVFLTLPGKPNPSKKIFDEGVVEWDGGIIHPFSRFNATPLVKGELHNYPMGHPATHLHQADTKLRFDDAIYTFEPDVQVCYNTFRASGGFVYYYNNCVPVEGASVVDLGLERGVRIFNYDEEKREVAFHLPTKNDFGNGLPATFPYLPQRPKPVDNHTTSLFFSIDGSGGPANTRSTPRQLEGQFIKNDLSKETMARLLPLPHLREVHLNPLFVLLSPHGARSSQCHINPSN